MRYNPKLNLKDFSLDDIKKISNDVFSGVKTGFLEDVDLSTPEGKQKYIDDIIAGKNPFQKAKDESLDLENKKVAVTESWTNIIEQAVGENQVVQANLNSKTPFDNSLLNTAYSKKIEEIRMETGLSSEEISSRILDEYSNNLGAHKSISSAVKFFHKVTADIFTECDSCGGDNAPAWEICQHCGKPSEG